VYEGESLCEREEKICVREGERGKVCVREGEKSDRKVLREREREGERGGMERVARDCLTVSRDAVRILMLPFRYCSCVLYTRLC
jgi:hypothetical protein